MNRCNSTKNNTLGSKEGVVRSRDLLFKFWDPLRNFWTGEARHFVLPFLDRPRWVLYNGRWITRKIHYTVQIYDI